MKSFRVVWPAVNQVEIEEFEVREPGPGEVLLEAECSLISPGTERGWLTGTHSIDVLGEQFPFIPGYSFAGRVKALGPGVTRFNVGDAVVTAGYSFGCHSAHVTFPEQLVTPVPDGIAFESAVFSTLAMTAIYGARRARIEFGESVAILGQGPIGLLAVQIARIAGGSPVLAFDLLENRLEMSRALGADRAVNVRDPKRIEDVLAGLDGGGANVVMDLTAKPDPINLAIQIVKPLGRVVALSPHSGGKIPTDLHGLFMKGAQLIGALVMARPMHDSQPGNWTASQDLDTFFRFLQDGRLEVTSLITHHFPGKDAPKAYDLLKAGDPSLIGAMLHWR